MQWLFAPVQETFQAELPGGSELGSAQDGVLPE
jgi:hypothetical protein